MPDVCYKKNFITKVILRVDFEKLSEEQIRNQPSFSQLVTGTFPHMSTQPMVEMEIDVGEDTSVKRTDAGNQWTYKKKIDGTVQLVLGHSFLAVEYGPADYQSYPSFYADFEIVHKALLEVFNIKQCSRIGLRYINEIRLPGRALDWEGIIAQRLLDAVLAGALTESRLIRSMHQYIQLKDQDQGMLNYGIFNPDFPAPAVQRHFILDIDCSRRGVIDCIDFSDCVHKLNDMCTVIFEASIEEKLREEMGVLK